MRCTSPMNPPWPPPTMPHRMRFIARCLLRPHYRGEAMPGKLEHVPAKCTHFADKNMLQHIDSGALSYRRDVSTESALTNGSGEIGQFVQFDLIAPEMGRHPSLREYRQIVGDRQRMAEIVGNEDYCLSL